MPWSAEQKAAFLRQQYEAQDAHYRQHYAGARFDVIEIAGRPVGRLYVARWPREIRVVDIAIVPEERRHGLGSAFLRDLIEEARGSGRRVTVHVERMNPALRLYRRLGFREVEDKGVYLFLEWPPEGGEVTRG